MKGGSNTEMKKEKKKEGAGLVPRLRFPEFRDAGEWEEKRLGDVCLINPARNELPDKFVYIDLESVESGKLLQKKIIKKKDAPSRAQRVLVDNDIIFQVVRPYQKNNYFCKFDDLYNYVASTGYAQLRSFDISLFLFQVIHTDLFVLKVIEKCTGSNYPAINSSDLSNIKVTIPKPSEQQKIADCLSSLDDLINAQQEKIESLKKHKKGLMQQLFPTEGSKVPRLRFPEFRDAGEWEEKRLGEIIEVLMCKRVLKHETSATGDIPFYKIGTFGKTPDSFISKELFNNYKNKYPFPKTGEILISAAGTIGRTVIYDGKPAYFQDSNIVWMSNSEVSLKNVFLYFYFNIIKWNTEDTTISRLYNNNIRGMLIYVPKPPEQQKIADCLSSLDDLINAQQEKLESLKNHKKGLMQQLFPSSRDIQ
ncbi:MAG TPA: restriction endonuclease subunit S [Oligoflexia bacterium]|nr:restriction endonuclease subunit S [Oligoflexia bacterium]